MGDMGAPVPGQALVSDQARSGLGPAGFDPSRGVMRLSRFMGEQEEREAVVDWLRSVGDNRPHGTDWRTYYEIADAIELGRHRDSDGNPEGGDGTAPSRSDDSAGAKPIAMKSQDKSS